MTNYLLTEGDRATGSNQSTKVWKFLETFKLGVIADRIDGEVKRGILQNRLDDHHEGQRRKRYEVLVGRICLIKEAEPGRKP